MSTWMLEVVEPFTVQQAGRITAWVPGQRMTLSPEKAQIVMNRVGTKVRRILNANDDNDDHDDVSESILTRGDKGNFPENGHNRHFRHEIVIEPASISPKLPPQKDNPRACAVDQKGLIAPLQPGWLVVYRAQGRLMGGAEDRERGTVQRCQRHGGGWMVVLTNGAQLPLGRIRGVAKTDASGAILAAWSVYEHDPNGGIRYTSMGYDGEGRTR